MNPSELPQQPATEPQQYDPSKLHRMVVMQPGEQVIAEVKRHPIGIAGMYVAAGFVVVVAASVAVALVPNLQDQYNIPNLATWAYLALGVISLGMVLILWAATTVYAQNRWIVTTDSITQIAQNSLLGRQVSQLSMDNLEDVTVQQNGLFPHMFNYGTLRVETAGERSKFFFQYCPNPNETARKILEAHEAFVYDKVKRNPPAQQPQAMQPMQVSPASPVMPAQPQDFQANQPYMQPPQSVGAPVQQQPSGIPVPQQYQPYPTQPAQPPEYPWQQQPPQQ